jgi:hypothetical protein
MRLLYFVLTPQGLGEVVIALSLARQLEPAGAKSHFVVLPGAEAMLRDSGHPYTVVEPSMGDALYPVVDDLVAQFRPDGLVLADYFTYWVIAEGQFHVDPWFVYRYGLPVIPVDQWEWDRTDFTIDIAPGLRRPVDPKILDMPARLHPVPLSHMDGQGPGYPYRLLAETDRIGAARRREVRGSLGIGTGERMVLLPISGWQQPAGRPAHDSVVRLATHTPDLLAGYLRQLPASTHFVLVGNVPRALRDLPAGRTHALPPCSARRYSALLGAADAVVALTPPAMTLLRSVFADVAGLVLTNRHTVAADGDADRLDAELGGLGPTVRDWLGRVGPVHPFRLWPMSFFEFMRPLLAENPFLDAVSHAEILDETAVVDTLTRLLYDRPTQDRMAAARERYAAAVAALPDTVDVFATAARAAGMRTP